MEKQTYTVREAAALLGIPQSTLYQVIRDGRLDERITPVRFGSSIRIPKRDVYEVLRMEMDS